MPGLLALTENLAVTFVTNFVTILGGLTACFSSKPSACGERGCL